MPTPGWPSHASQDGALGTASASAPRPEPPTPATSVTSVPDPPPSHPGPLPAVPLRAPLVPGVPWASPGSPAVPLTPAHCYPLSPSAHPANLSSSRSPCGRLRGSFSPSTAAGERHRRPPTPLCPHVTPALVKVKENPRAYTCNKLWCCHGSERHGRAPAMACPALSFTCPELPHARAPPPIPIPIPPTPPPASWKRA